MNSFQNVWRQSSVLAAVVVVTMAACGSGEIPDGSCSTTEDCALGSVCDDSGQCVMIDAATDAATDADTADAADDADAPDCVDANDCVTPTLCERAANAVCNNEGHCVYEPAVVCDTPPADECVGDNLLTYISPGTCVPSTGMCTYTASVTECLNCVVACLGGCYTAADCDDGNPCTADTCNSFQRCENEPVPVGTTCDDGKLCTLGDACDGMGLCLSGAQRDCSSFEDQCNGNSFCDVSDGQCKTVPKSDTTLCSDRDNCTYNEHCDGAGSCISTTLVCTNTFCMTRTCVNSPSCATTPRNYGTSCSDSDPCTYNTTCNIAGQCTGPISCTPSTERNGTCWKKLSCNNTATCTSSSNSGSECFESSQCGTCNSSARCTNLKLCP